MEIQPNFFNEEIFNLNFFQSVIPEKLTEEKLKKLIDILKNKIILQRQINSNLLMEIRILDPAIGQMDMDKQNLLVELMNLEEENNH